MFKDFKNTAYIALGSNKGNKIEHLRDAVESIDSDFYSAVEKISPVYETLPVGTQAQANYLNAVIKIRTNYLMMDLFKALKQIEKDLGRTESERWGPREIDLDLLFFNDEVYSDKNLTVPHSGITQRDFVLVPLCKIEPGLIHPELNKKICDICIEINQGNIIKELPADLLTTKVH